MCLIRASSVSPAQSSKTEARIGPLFYPPHRIKDLLKAQVFIKKSIKRRPGLRTFQRRCEKTRWFPPKNLPTPLLGGINLGSVFAAGMIRRSAMSGSLEMTRFIGASKTVLSFGDKLQISTLAADELSGLRFHAAVLLQSFHLGQKSPWFCGRILAPHGQTSPWVV